MEDNATITFICASDSSESYKEKDVPLSEICNLVGLRAINVNKTFSHKISIAYKSVVTLVRDIRGHWYMADANGEYDPKWYLSDSMHLENVKLMQGLVVRGTLLDTNYGGNKKYYKQLEVNRDLFFTKNDIPVMTAKNLQIDSRGQTYGRGVK